MAEKGGVQRGRPVCSRKSSRVAEKLQQKIRDKEYYEAHQTYRALYQRYKAQGKESDALELLYDGAVLLLQHRQWSSGTDLGMLLIAHLKEHKTPVSKEWLEKIGAIFSQYEGMGSDPGPTPSDHAPSISAVFEVIPDVDSRESLIRAALKWSSIVGANDKWKYGHPELHKMAAMSYWKEKQYARARDHFLYAEQPQEFGAMLTEVATKHGYAGEADLFIAQAVLQLLVLKNRSGGLAVFNAYTRRHPKFKSENPPYIRHPLLNFIWFLLSACKDRNREVFDCLRKNYIACINRDPSFPEYLDKIGLAFFGPPVQPLRGEGSAMPAPGGLFGAGGLIEGLLNSFLPPRPTEGSEPPRGHTHPQGTATSSVPPTQGTTQATFSIPPMGTFSHEVGPIQFGPGGEISQTQHIHLGQIPIPPVGAVPPGGIQFTIPAGGPFNVSSGGIQIGAPPEGQIFTSTPQPTPSAPQPRGIPFGVPHAVNIRPAPHMMNFPPHPTNNQPAVPLPGNIRVGTAGPGHISVVGFRMEGIPLPAVGVPPMGGEGPFITPAQQQMYQQHSQQPPPDSGGQPPPDSGGQDPHQDMELD